ncbi:hypothetical protein AB0M97_22905 [Streptomyces sp. NPDC051207]|uniref:hypothetical protein n=1 Tax=Streptomyces sp. NPDC051207 TaxID=3154641 RepID=UPI003433D80C
MNRRLARHTLITRLRAQRPVIPDQEVRRLYDEVAASGLVEEIEPLIANVKGRRCTLSLEALLVGMALAAQRNSGVVTFTTVTNLLYFSLSGAMREQLCLHRYPDHDRGFEAAYAVVRRRLHSILKAIDPSPLPKNHRLARRHAEKVLAKADPQALARKRARLLRVSNMILGMSLREALPLLEEHWDGSVSLDATAIGTYAKGLPPHSPVTSTDPDAGWYVRTTRHQDPLALADLTPAESAGGRQKTSGQKKTERIKKRLFGYDASLVVARDPEHHGAPLPDGSANPDVVPALIVAFSVDKPSHRPGQVAVEALQHVDDRFPPRLPGR